MKNYNQILNNLLNISARGDQAIFTNLGLNMFDTTRKFGKSISEKIINQKSRTFKAEDLDLPLAIAELEKAVNPEEMIEIIDNYGLSLSNSKKVVLKKSSDFEGDKKRIIDKYEEDYQKSKLKWAQFRRKVIDENIESNIWPLHFATCFIALASPIKTIYAPAFLREATIDIHQSTGEVSIKSNGDWFINDKLMFILNESGYAIDSEMFYDCEDLKQLRAKLETILNIKFPEDLVLPLKQLKTSDITNKLIETHAGIVLGLFKPSGGILRKMMQTIIKNEEVDDILDPEIDKKVYKDNIDKFVKNTNNILFHIQPSNFSQEIALISSLKQDTIIWGPPGTGKSQVIANIIANILEREKSALIASQKKAALEVLKKRLGSLPNLSFLP